MKRIFRKAMPLLLVVLLMILASGCRTMKHKCSDCPTFSYHKEVVKQKV